MTGDAPEDAPEETRAERVDRRAELVSELQKGRHVRYLVTSVLGVVIGLMLAGFAYYRFERTHECRNAYRVREHAEDLDERLFRRLGERLQADEAEIDEFLAVIHYEYDTMPTPAACD